MQVGVDCYRVCDSLVVNLTISGMNQHPSVSLCESMEEGGFCSLPVFSCPKAYSFVILVYTEDQLSLID